jgi:hypothetical protein
VKEKKPRRKEALGGCGCGCGCEKSVSCQQLAAAAAAAAKLGTVSKTAERGPLLASASEHHAFGFKV